MKRSSKTSKIRWRLSHEPPRLFCIFIATVCEGAVPLVKGTTVDDTGDALEGICLFSTELEAQHEIADAMMTRLQEFMDGERDFEDAITVEEYGVKVELDPNGAVVEVGR